MLGESLLESIKILFGGMMAGLTITFLTGQELTRLNSFTGLFLFILIFVFMFIVLTGLICWFKSMIKNKR